MAWNRPKENGEAVSRPLQNRSGDRFPVRGAIAGAIVVLGAAVAAWWLWPSGESAGGTPPPQTKGLIAEVAPTAAPQPIQPKPGMVIATNKFGRVYEHPITNAWGNPWSWGPQKLRPAFTSRIDRASQPLYMRVFRNAADRRIASLLLLEPGTPLIGGDEPCPGIEKAFARSLENPVLVTHDDTDEVKELKRAVNEAKADLKQRVDAGEDLVKILTDARRELRELGAYRQELQKQIDQYRSGREATPEDLHDMVDAANLMLKERGLKQLSVPEFYYKNLETRIKLRKARESNEK